MHFSNLFYGGRIGRMTFFVSAVVLFFSVLITNIIGNVLTSSGNGLVNMIGWLFLLLSILLSICSLILGISLSMRRWHDMDKHGWMVLLQLIPLVNFVVLAIMLFKKGTEGPNQFGSGPARGSLLDVLLNNVPAGATATVAAPPTQAAATPPESSAS